jgi:hypothetical protein
MDKDDLIRRLVELLSRKDLELLVSRLEQERPKEPEPDWNTAVGHCPKCGHSGTVAKDFGTVLKRGIRRPQSWCKWCRARTHYHARPRRNRVR